MWTQPLNILTPSQIFGSNLKHWYHPGGIVDSGSGTCSQWTDNGAGTTYNLTQATSTKMPTISTADFNGESHITWNNVSYDINLAHSSFTQTNAVTLFMVCKGFAGLSCIFIDCVAQSNHSIYFAREFTNTWTLQGKSNGSPSTQYSLLYMNDAVPNNTLFISQCGKYVSDATSRTFWGNNFTYISGRGPRIFAGNFIQDQNRSSYDHIDSTAGLKLCAHYSGTSVQSIGKIAEFGFVDATTPQMSNTKITQLNRYVLSRYNLSF